MSNVDGWLTRFSEIAGDEASFAEFYRQLLDDSLAQGATAIHLHFANNELQVRFRIDGKLHSRCAVSPDVADGLLWAIKLHAQMDVFERRRAQDGRGTHRTEAGDRLIRVAFIPASQGPSVTLQWIEEDNRCRQLHEIGLLPAQQAVVEEMLQNRVGFVVVGCSGFSGRRTMGHALLLAAKQAGNACLSLEWYVSRPIPGISQCEFTPRDSKVKQWQWFQAALRRRPDVVFIEHPGNEDTIGHVLAAARSSCLVIAAMGRRFEHLIDYLDSLGVPPDVSTTTLLGVIEQRLVPRVCPDCAECYTPKLQELRELRIRCERPNELVFCRCTGCNQCGRTGRAGVVGVHEIATMTEALQNMFLRKMPSERIRQQLFDGGMTTFYESAVHKLVHGQIASTTVAFFSRWLNQQNDWIRVDATTGECSRES